MSPCHNLEPLAEAGTHSRLLSVKPELVNPHCCNIYPHVRGVARHVKSTSQLSLAFSYKLRDDWCSLVNPKCCQNIRCLFPPSENEDYVRDRDISS